MRNIFKALIGMAAILFATNAAADERQAGLNLKPHATTYQLISAHEGKNTLKVFANANMPLTCEVLDISQPVFIRHTNKTKHGTYSYTNLTFKSVFKKSHVPECLGKVDLSLPRRFILVIHNDNPIELPVAIQLETIPHYILPVTHDYGWPSTHKK
jgi:hypothetical protein